MSLSNALLVADANVIAHPGDAAANINALISAAPDNATLVIPNAGGTLLLGQAIVLPVNRHGVTLDFSNNRFAPASGYTGKLFTAGKTGIDSAIASTELSGISSSNVSQPTKGASTLTSTSGSPTTGYYWLAGDTQLGTSGLYPEGEWVRVTNVNGTTLTLESPLLRTYRGAAKLYVMSATRCSNITIKNFRAYGKSASTYLADVFYCALIDGLTLTNIVVSGYSARAIQVQSCRNVTISNCVCGEMDPSVYSTGGKGYGIQVQRCATVAISNCTGADNRHIVTIHGSANGTITNCSDTSSHGTFPDFHGNGEEDWTISGTSVTKAASSGSADAAFGNGNYSYGCSGVTMTSHTGGASCYVYAGTTSLSVSGVSWSANIILYSSSAGRPVSASFTNCSCVGFDDGGAVASSAVRFHSDGATHGITTLNLTNVTATDVAGANARGLYVPSVAVDTTINISGGTWGNAAGDYAMEVNHSGAGTLTINVSGGPSYSYTVTPWKVGGSTSPVIGGVDPGDIE